MDLSTVLDDLIIKFSNVPTRLKWTALGLCTTFIMWEIIYQIVFQNNRKPLGLLMDNIKRYIITYFFILNYETIITKINETFIYFAVKGAGGGNQNITGLPSKIIKKGISETNKILEEMSYVDPKTWVYGFIWLVGILIILYLALQIFLAFLEYSAIMAILIIIIPFSLFSVTKEWGTKVYSIIFSQNIKIFMITFLSYFLLEYLNTTINAEDNFSVISYIGGIAGLSFVLSKASELVGGIFTGTPALGGVSGSEFKGMAGSAVGGAIGGAKGAVVGTKAVNAGMMAGGIAKGLGEGPIGIAKAGVKGAMDKAKEFKK